VLSSRERERERERELMRAEKVCSINRMDVSVLSSFRPGDTSGRNGLHNPRCEGPALSDTFYQDCANINV
jgi:hypothetical protein